MVTFEKLDFNGSQQQTNGIWFGLKMVVFFKVTPQKGPLKYGKHDGKLLNFGDIPASRHPYEGLMKLVHPNLGYKPGI